MHLNKKKIYFIIGPTASGKTALSIELAKKLQNSEIISADSRQIYRDLDLSTGKVTEDEKGKVPHHLLDIKNPGEYFSVVDFTNLALQKISEIYSRGNIPIICGGTGFYIDALLYDYKLPEVKSDEKLRKILEQKNTEELFAILKNKLIFNLSNFRYLFANLQTLQKFSEPDFRKNKHRLMRAIEIVNALGYIPKLQKEKRFNEKEYDVEIISTNVPRAVLREKIYKRLIERIDQGMIAEIAAAKEKYNLDFKYLEKLGLEFKWTAKFLQGQISKEKMIENLNTEIGQYAKRQETWFSRYK